MTLFDIKNMENMVIKIAKCNTLSVPVAYNFMVFYKKYLEELKNIEDVRQKLVLKYGSEEPASGTIRVEPGNFDKFQEEYLQLLQQEANILTDKFPVSAFDTLKFTPEELLALEPIIKNE